MSVAFALLTSDPSLVRCELSRLAGQVSLQAERANAVGVGTHLQDEVLLQRLAENSGLNVESIAPHPESETLLFHARRLPAEQSPEENTQPFRFRRWLFAHQGTIERFADLRESLVAGLPDFLRRQLHGESESEVAFAVFLKHLREVGRTEDRKLEAALAGKLLAATARELAQASSEAGAARVSTLNLFATNGRVFAVTRFGEVPLHYAGLEGTDRCERCGLDARSPEASPLVMAHRRHRSVAVATHLTPRASGWTELPHGQTLAVDAELRIHGPF